MFLESRSCFDWNLVAGTFNGLEFQARIALECSIFEQLKANPPSSKHKPTTWYSSVQRQLIDLYTLVIPEKPPHVQHSTEEILRFKMKQEALRFKLKLGGENVKAVKFG